MKIYFEVLMSGLKLSRRACRSHKLTSPLGPLSGLSAGCCGCDPRRDHDGAHDSSYAVACRVNRDSLRFIRLLHCVVESRRPDLGTSNFGLVAGGVTELIIIVGIGIDCDDESTCRG